MKKEFFGSDLVAAVEKAALAAGVPPEQVEYREIEGAFGAPLGSKKVAIVVEMEERQERPATISLEASNEEIQARDAGETQWATYLLAGIFARLGMNTRITSKEKGEYMVLNVQLEDADADLRRGSRRELRGAVQHLINRALSRGKEMGRRYIVDVGGTLEDRSRKMAEFGRELAGKVGRLATAVHIHLMDSQDRRLLHLNLLEEGSTTTVGRGEKQFRILSIEPKKNEGEPKKEQG